VRKLPHPCTIDCETFGIEGRPDYPPKIVGIAIKKWGKKSRYYAFGHMTGGNNCTETEALSALREVWDTSDGLLMHNARFDLDCIETHWDLALPSWDRVHETMFLAFLSDPHARELGLKSLAHNLLGMPPEERDVVADWLIEHQPVEGVRIGRSAKGKEPPGKYIAYAPGDVVGPYALGDVDRTEALFRHLYPSIVEREMLAAYNRERKLVPILLGMERAGIRVDLPRLQNDVQMYSEVLTRLDAWVRKKYKIPDEVNLDSGAQLVVALEECGLLDRSVMGITKTGKVKTDKAALALGCKDDVLAAILRYRAQLGTCLHTFMEPWASTAERSGGYIYTNWNQTRGGKGGTRTGRFSSSETNFQNVPKTFDPIFHHDEEAKEYERMTGKRLPTSPIKSLHSLPLCRGYITPYEDGHVLVARDYSQQEPRILAHFENGALLKQYQDNPWIDFHDNAKDNLERIYKREFYRKPVKNINLGIIYGQGVYSLALRNGESVDTTKKVLGAILDMYPGLDEMKKDMKWRSKNGVPIRTWGGRVYFCEEPKYIEGKLQTFDYKMINTLVQGSAADCTKEAMIRFVAATAHRTHNREWRVLLQVHDEIVISVPYEDLEEAQEMLRSTMESVEFDVLILSEGSFSKENWAAMMAYDKKGNKVYVKAA
jgi:DNA polymerase I